MNYIKKTFVIIMIIGLTSCQNENQSMFDDNDVLLNHAGKQIAVASICDQQPVEVCGGCLVWEPKWLPTLKDTVDFGVITPGGKKDTSVNILVRRANHSIEEICIYGFQYPDEIRVFGYPTGPVQVGCRAVDISFIPTHGTGKRTGSIWLKYYENTHPDEIYNCELVVTARVLNSGGGGVIHSK